MIYSQTDIPDVVMIEPIVFTDNRGFFMETFIEDEFNYNVLDIKFVQENHSQSNKGVLRGLHYQIKNPQGKLIRAISGEIFDVAVDIRKKSPFFGKWVGKILSGENKKMLWIPPGFAHGFYVLSDKAEIVYKCTNYYIPEYERTILWNDKDISINWPIITGTCPILSNKDNNGLPLYQ